MKPVIEINTPTSPPIGIFSFTKTGGIVADGVRKALTTEREHSK